MPAQLQVSVDVVLAAVGKGIGSFDSKKETSPGFCRSMEENWIVDDSPDCASTPMAPRWLEDAQSADWW